MKTSHGIRGVALAALLIPIVFGAVPSSGRPAALAMPVSVLTIGRVVSGRPIPPGFVGLSLEITSVERYAGTDPGHVDPVLVQLIRNLAPNQRPVLRLGGDSTDWTWFPVVGLRRPPGVRFALTPRWLAVTGALAKTLDARLIVGINLEANSRRVAGVEARAVIRGIGRSWVQALELGNEPELYGSARWARRGAGRGLSRPAPYGFDRYLVDYSRLAGALPRVALAGPSIGSLSWMSRLARFLVAEPRVKIVTLHRYPLKHCSPQHVDTIGELLSNASANGPAISIARYAVMARARGLRLRVDEMNSVTCGGQRGVSDTFASALWSVDALFEMARVGVDGVNIHSHPRSSNELFTIRRVSGSWRATVHPEYYGLMMFAQAAPAGSRLLRLSSPTTGHVGAWATAGPDKHTRVVLINRDSSAQGIVLVRDPSAIGTATIERLQAPGLSATTTVTLGGQTFGGETSTGLLTGTPQPIAVAPHAHVYTVRVPPASAAMLTLPTR